MELFLLRLYFFLRPIMLMKVFYYKIGSFNLFEIFAIICFVLFYLFLMKKVLFKELQIELIDVMIYIIVLWFCFVFYLHYQSSSIKFLAVFIIPLFSFSVIKNIIKDVDEYSSLLFWFIMGMTIPIIYSCFLIIQGKSIANFYYLDNIVRYQGAYLNPHNCGHSMALFLILTIIMYEICKAINIKKYYCFKNFISKNFLIFLIMLALFCLYKSHVRTAYIGLTIFLFIYFFYYNKKYFFIFLFLTMIIFFYKITFLEKEFYDIAMVLKHKWSKNYLGSGRIYIWTIAINYFLNQDLSNLLSGLGINRHLFSKYITDSHNDFLELLIETGFIGLFLYVLIQFLIFKKIVNMSSSEKWAFLAFFISVVVMNFISNSYITRFAFAQVYYMIMCYPYIKEKSKSC